MAIEIVQTSNPSLPKKQAVRAVAFREGKLLLMHVRNSNTYVLPGGGVKDGENLEEALVREIREETGYEVEAFSHCLRVSEKHERYFREHHIFKVRLGKIEQEQSLTDEEQSLRLCPIWLDIPDAIERLAANRGTHELSEAIQTREFIAVMHAV